MTSLQCFEMVIVQNVTSEGAKRHQGMPCTDLGTRGFKMTLVPPLVTDASANLVT